MNTSSSAADASDGVRIPRVYGIDLGATSTSIAYVNENGVPTVVANAEGELATPSVVFFESPTEVIVGKEAQNNALISPDLVVEMVMRHMGNSSWRFSYNDILYTPEELSSYILRKVVNGAEVAIGETITDVVITCPAYFDLAQREAIKTAGALASLKVWEVVEAPVCAAIAYSLQNEGEQTALIYDLGGCTLDLAVVEIKNGSLSVLVCLGDHHLRGRDWDETVVNWVSEEWMRKTGSSDDPRQDYLALQDLWAHAEAAKLALSHRTQVRISLTHAGLTATIVLTRQKFDELTAGLLDRTVHITRSALGIAAQKEYASIDTMLLIGNATAMLQVSPRLRAAFANDNLAPQYFDPGLAVVKGAAIYGQRLAVADTISRTLRNDAPRVIQLP